MVQDSNRSELLSEVFAIKNKYKPLSIANLFTSAALVASVWFFSSQVDVAKREPTDILAEQNFIIEFVSPLEIDSYSSSDRTR